MKINFNLKNKTNLIVYAILALIILGGAYYTSGKINNLKDKVTVERNLTRALTDSLDVYTNERNELVAEKLTLQVKVKDLNELNDNLTQNQRELVTRISELKKEKDIIAAALVETSFKIDSLLSDADVTIADSSVTFTKTDDDISYKIRVNNVTPLGSFDPSLYFEKIEVFNKQFVEFHWDDNRKYGYPVSFSITNSNKFFVTNNVDSYIIPEIKKAEIKPTFWQKVGNTFSEGKNKTVWFGLGAGATALTFFLLK